MNTPVTFDIKFYGEQRLVAPPRVDSVTPVVKAIEASYERGLSADRWDRYFLGMASYVAGKSKDDSTRVGCVIVGPDNEIRSTGYNDFPRGVNDAVAERRQRPEKYLWTEHAERNAIYNAARVGIPLKGSRAYVSCMFVCMDCARALVQAGITEIVCEEPKDGSAALADRWKDDIARTSMLFEEAGVTVRTLEAV